LAVVGLLAEVAQALGVAAGQAPGAVALMVAAELFTQG
jgi:hypothetical protein